MENTEEEINLNNSDYIITEKSMDKENKEISDEFKIINNTDNNEDIILENYSGKYSSSEDISGKHIPLVKKKPKIMQNNLSLSNISEKKNNYIYREKMHSKLLKSNTITNYNLELSSFQSLYNFQNKFTSNENDIKKINKCLHSYSFKCSKDEINQIFFYILKNYKKSNKKYILTRNKINKGLDIGNISILDTLKIHLDNKTKEMITSRNNNNIQLINKENYISYKNAFINGKNHNKHKENKDKLKLNLKKSSVNTKKIKKENMYFKNDEDLVKFVKNKIRQKNSYYIIKLKNKSHIYNIKKTKKIKTKTTEKKSLDINKIKEDNIKIRFKNIKLKKNYEQIKKELKILKDNNKELKNEIIKKEILIQKYEHQINENKNKIQNLIKKLSEYTKNRKILIYQKEIELFFSNKINTNTNKKHFIQFKIEKNLELNLNFEKGKFNKRIFDDNLSITKIEQLNFMFNKVKKNFNFVISNFLEINYIKTKQKEKENISSNKFFKIIKINDIYFKKTKKNEIKSFNQNLSKENIFDFNIIKDKNIKIFETKSLCAQTIEICQLSILRAPKKICNFVISEQKILSILKTPKIICNLVISEHKMLSFVKSPKKICNLAISRHIILSFLKKEKIIKENILKIMKLDTFSFNQIININKFKNLEISKSDISLEYKTKIQEKNNSEYNTNNNTKNDNNKISNMTKTELNNDEKKSEEKKEELNTKNEKLEKLNRAMNRIRRKNQSLISDSNQLNTEEYPEFQNYQTKRRFDTVRIGKSGKILDIAKKLEKQINKSEDNTNKNIETKKNENSNMVEIISTQPVIKNKKKKKKINFVLDD